MKVTRPRFVPDASSSHDEMKRLQHDIADNAVFSDGRDARLDADTRIAGVDQAFDGETAVSAVVVMQDGEIIERVHAARPVKIPYIPGLLSFREGGAIVAALQNLEREPDVLLVDGCGRMHFREAGLATHIGVTFDVPAIGVAKSLLCGTPTESTENLDEGNRVPIEADGTVTAPDGSVIGYAVQTRQYRSPNRYINPVYVSPGHRISAETAVDAVVRAVDGYKLPEPVRQADQYAGEVTA